MKLRNKIDGTITEGDVWIETKVHRESWQCKSLEELNEHWEDYKEPLIKDEKIRKIVRAWADNLQAFMCDGEITFYDDKAYRTFQTDVWKGCNIRDIAELDLVFDEDSLEDGKIYTIAELCGEEEEE